MRQASKWVMLGTLLLAAVLWVSTQTLGPDFIGICFVQFRAVGRHVALGGNTAIYKTDVRAEILESTWKEAETVGTSDRYSRAVGFRHARSLESYSSPFMYSMFAVMAESEKAQAVGWESPSNLPPSSGSSAVYSPGRGQKEKGAAEYDAAIYKYWMLCLGSTILGIVGFGWVLRIPDWAIGIAAVLLVSFNPLLIDLKVANVNQIQLGMIGILAGVLCYGREARFCRRIEGCTPGWRDHYSDLIGGFWLAICLAFKPNLLWCGVMLVVPRIWAMRSPENGRVRSGTGFEVRSIGELASRDGIAGWGRRSLISAVIGGLLGTVVTLAFSAIWFPLSSWLEWVEAVRMMPDDILRVEQGNFSPTYYLQHFVGIPRWLLGFCGPLLAAVVVWSVAGGMKRRNASNSAAVTTGEVVVTDTRNRVPVHIEDALWISVGCQIHLLTSHLVWYHYFVLAIPAMLIVLREIVTEETRSLKFVQTLLLVWCVVLLGSQPLDGWIKSTRYEGVFRCLFANGFLLLLVVMALRRRLQRGME